MRAISKPHERIRKRAICVHGHVARNVVEDIRLGQVVQPRKLSDSYGRGEFAIPEAVEEEKCRYVSADRLRLESGERLQELVYFLQLRHAIVGQREIGDSLQAVIVCALLTKRLQWGEHSVH